MKKGGRNIWIGVSLLALALAGTAIGAATTLFDRAIPDYTGEEKIASLAAPVRVMRDGYGVPHLFAQNEEDAARALGYVHAGERLFQMEMQRRAGQGRLAEIFGSDMLGVDKLTRTLGLYALAQSSFAAMDPAAQKIFRAYADGVNAWLDAHRDRLPPAFLLLGCVPEPWQPADSVVWGKLMAWELSHNYRMELLRAKLAGVMPSERLAWLFPMPPEGTPVTTMPVAQGRTDRADDRLAAFLGLDHAASNEWAIGGARTQSGKPILANDPHLGLEAPILWYLARLVTPQGSVKGATVPGLPLVLLGQNDHVAWGFTTTGSDVQDLFVETLDPQNPDRYLTPQGSEAFAAREEVIHVKNAPDVVLKTRETFHGPVLSDIDADMAAVAGKGKAMSLAFTGLGDKDLTSQALWRASHAPNADAFVEALRAYQAPPQNIVYADDAGAFGYLNPGLVPVRKKGDGLIPADGASGAYDWDGAVPFDSLPHVENPASGVVFNANNAVVAPGDSPYLGQDWEEPYRARRIQQIFDAAGPFTLEKAAAMQADKTSLVAADFLPMLASLTPQNAREKQALAILASWDGAMDADKAAPVIFEAWLYNFRYRMLEERVGLPMKEKGPFAAMTLMDLARNHSVDWCGIAGCLPVAAQALDDALDMMQKRQGPDMAQWRWGRENVASLKNKFYSHIPLLDKLSDLSVESGGDFYTLDRGGGFDNDADHPFARTHGGGFRGVYDLAHPDASLFMIATGQSEHIFSAHYGDLVRLWRDGKYITLSGDAEALKARGAEELDLTP